MDYCFEQRGPEQEVCDSKDNNCDGIVDNDCLMPMNQPLDTPVIVDPNPN